MLIEYDLATLDMLTINDMRIFFTLLVPSEGEHEFYFL